MDEAVKAARSAASGGDAFLPDQFSNPANPEAHRRAPARRSWRRSDDKVDVFVAGVGTGGTITGVGETLKARNPKAAGRRRRARVVGGPLAAAARARTASRASAPASSPPCSTVRSSTRSSPVSDDDAIATAHLCAAREGVLAGISCGAALWGALRGRPARPRTRGKRIVAILPDSGERYISAPFFAPQ